MQQEGSAVLNLAHHLSSPWPGLIMFQQALPTFTLEATTAGERPRTANSE